MSVTVYGGGGSSGVFGTTLGGGGSRFGTASGMLFSLADNKMYLSGTLIAVDGEFSGSLKAATGTFSGELEAATGTFSGELEAATGTFSGELEAATGTFEGSLIGGRVLVNDGSNSVEIDDAKITFQSGTAFGGTAQSEIYGNAGGGLTLKGAGFTGVALGDALSGGNFVSWYSNALRPDSGSTIGTSADRWATGYFDTVNSSEVKASDFVPTAQADAVQFMSFTMTQGDLDANRCEYRREYIRLIGDSILTFSWNPNSGADTSVLSYFSICRASIGALSASHLYVGTSLNYGSSNSEYWNTYIGTTRSVCVRLSGGEYAIAVGAWTFVNDRDAYADISAEVTYHRGVYHASALGSYITENAYNAFDGSLLSANPPTTFTTSTGTPGSYIDLRSV